MNAIAMKLAGYFLWRGGKWYLRRRLPPMRTLATSGFAALLVLVTMAILARRLGG